MFGVVRKKVIGKSIFDFVPAEARGLILERFQSETPEPFETPATRVDGTRLLFEVFPKQILFQGELVRMVAVRDITERKKAEEELRESESRLSSFMESASDSFYLLDPDLNFVEINKRGLKIIGKDKKDVIGKNIAEIVPNIKESGRYEKHLEVIKTGEPFVIQDFVPHPVFGNLHFLLKSFKVGDGLGVIASDITERKQAEKNLAEAYDTTLEGWAKALEMRDKETKDHSQRVVELTVALAKVLGIEGEELTHIRRGAILHDIGKMGIPDEILRKRGALTISERKIIEQHPTYSLELLSRIPYLEKALDIPYCHHERWDGNGYPRGLKGEEIPLAARIFSVVDVWDAICSDRPYSKAWSKEKAIQYLKEETGKYFDPEIVDTFLNLIV
jgi:PAS domain S-box-containing protein/putative nucleotidyltransferase with HDIG domain